MLACKARNSVSLYCRRYCSSHEALISPHVVSTPPRSQGRSSRKSRSIDVPTEQKEYPRNYFAERKNRRTFMEELGSDMNFTSWKDYYLLRYSDIVDFGGETLLHNIYNGSVRRAIMDIFPEYEWDPMNFQGVNQRWEGKGVSAHRKIFDLMAARMKLSTMDDWYQVRVRDIAKHGGGGVLAQFYGNSPLRALKAIYPEHNWQFWKFSTVPHHHWDNEDDVRDYIKWVQGELGIEKLDDWYSVTLQQLRILGGGWLPTKYTSLPVLLKMVFPEHDWETKKFHGAQYPLDEKRHTGKHQLLIAKRLCQILPHITDMEIEYKHPTLKFDESGREMIFDIYIPSLSLALEYQGKQHYEQHFLFGSPQDLQRRDSAKEVTCAREGVTLIPIPYWWDLSKDSLLATISAARPDAVANPNNYQPIPEINPGLTGDNATSMAKFPGTKIRANDNGISGRSVSAAKRHFCAVKSTEQPWKDFKFQRQFFDSLALTLQISTWQDWYRVNQREIKLKGGTTAQRILDVFNESHISALLTLYPEHPWKVASFSSVPVGFWLDVNNQRAFMDEVVRQKLDIKDDEAWYSVTKTDIFNSGGSSFLHYYGNDSLYDILSAIYPEKNWSPEKFTSDSGVWRDKEVQRDFFDRAAKMLNIRHWEDWYQVTTAQINQMGGVTLLRHFGGSLVKALQSVYPEHPWDITRRYYGQTSFKGKMQIQIFKAVQYLFPEKNLRDLLKLHPSDLPVCKLQQAHGT
eukprot:TRINITY_DN5254_c0_g1_i1.p1 TRINITY_DN5254_c0_g1~~TRINITY_DN5254_c0_g1_i1.p1  ORF type:complete len:742 (+),score=155.67 TRINITY_DN5254_c0_g1_i1:67-2292(+)